MHLVCLDDGVGRAPAVPFPLQTEVVLPFLVMWLSCHERKQWSWRRQRPPGIGCWAKVASLLECKEKNGREMNEHGRGRIDGGGDLVEVWPPTSWRKAAAKRVSRAGGSISLVWLIWLTKLHMPTSFYVLTCRHGRKWWAHPGSHSQDSQANHTYNCIPLKP